MEESGPLAPNSSVNNQDVPGGLLQTSGADGQKGQETNEVYEETAAINCDQDKAAAPKQMGKKNSSIIYTKKLSDETDSHQKSQKRLCNGAEI